MTRLIPALVIAFICTALSSSQADDARPNILYIMSDDHAAHAISAYGGRLANVARTPNIDRLANEGALFTNVFCTNSICSPSRACVLTGQYNHVNGAFDLAGSVKPGKQMLAIEMKKAGYHTAMIGKWHLKEEPADFDHYCVLPGQGNYHDPVFRVRGDKPWGKNTIAFPGMHSSDAITDQSIAWLNDGWDRSQPFFLMHHFKAPHDYFDNAPRYDNYLADVEIPEPKSLWSRGTDFGSIATRGANDELVPHIGTSIGSRNPRRSYLIDLPAIYPKEFPENFDPAKYTDEQNKHFAYQAYLRKYLRCVKGVDDNLGRLFSKLEELDQLDNTVIIYTSDQGFMLGEHDYQDKRWMFEESQRMPFLIRYPSAIKAGSRIESLIENVDFAPTLLEFVGAETPDSVQGRSFKSIATGQPEPEDWRKAVYYRYWMHMAHHDNPAHVGIRTKNHKLVYYYGCNYEGGYQTPPGWELYDMVSDPHETRNLIDAADMKQTVDSLKSLLAKTREAVGDDGSHHPACEKIVQEFWDYDANDRQRAIEISHEFLKRRQSELEQGQRNVHTW